jgi:DNA-directed RNA polymerase specialized sigma subunit
MAAYSGEVFAARAYQAGIPARIVYQKYRNWGMNHQRAVELADDAAAEAYYRSLTHCFHSEEHYQAWVAKTALHFVIDKLRRESRSQALTWIASLADRASDQGLDANAVAAGLATLASDERILLTMTFEEDLTLDEIAGHVAASDPGSPTAKRLRIKRKRDRALSKLKAYLVKQGYCDNRPAPPGAASDASQA